MSKEYGGHGWNQVDNYFGVTYYGGKLKNIIQFLNNLPSDIWVENRTKDTLNYDIIYWKKNQSLTNVYEEIQKNLLGGLSMKLEKTKEVKIINKLKLYQENEKVLKEAKIIDGTKKAYTSIDIFRAQLEKKTNEYFSIDNSLQNSFILTEDMEWQKLNSVTPEELVYFLKQKKILISKESEEIEIYNISYK